MSSEGYRNEESVRFLFFTARQSQRACLFETFARHYKTGTGSAFRYFALFLKKKKTFPLAEAALSVRACPAARNGRIIHATEKIIFARRDNSLRIFHW